jgi:hypothetical protein
MNTPAWELSTDVKLPYAVDESAGTPQDPQAAAAADGGIIIPATAGADARPQYISGPELQASRQIFSAVLGFVPEVGEWKNLYEGISGKDLVTGAEVEGWQRAVKLIAILPFEGGVSGGVVWGADKLDKLLDLISLVDGLVDLHREAERRESLDGGDPPPDPKAGPMHYPPHGTP